jgi:hypothetical protein
MSGSNKPGTYQVNITPPVESITPALPMRNRGGAFAGWSQSQLQAGLQQAQNALLQLTLGQQTFRVEYSEGSGHRGVTYTKADVTELRNVIRELEDALGINRRRALGIRF